MSANENGRPSAEAAGTPVALVPGASPVPNAYMEDSTLRLLREGDENATAGDLDEWVSYRMRWYAYLSGGAA